MPRSLSGVLCEALRLGRRRASERDPGSLTTEQRVKSQWALSRDLPLAVEIGSACTKAGHVIKGTPVPDMATL